MITAIVLAAGFSARMGEDKLSLLFGGKPLYRNAVDLIKKVKFNESVFICRNGDMARKVRKEGINVIINNNAAKGQSESIRIGIKNCSKSNAYMFLTADQPFLNESVVLSIIDAYQEMPDKIIVPVYKGKRGSPVIFPNKFRPDLLALTGDSGGKIIISKHNDAVFLVEQDSYLPLEDIDNKDDYERLSKLVNNT